MTTQLQQCREVAAALDEEVTEWRRKDAEWREHRNAAEKALHDMPFVMDNYRAALARAESAEAEAAEARAANGALAELAASETERRVALAERVAELEAALGELDDEAASASEVAAASIARLRPHRSGSNVKPSDIWPLSCQPLGTNSLGKPLL